ncbi:DUF5680 domain-containing protein [Pararhizobium sp. BT-229]|uniref:DUF5680 domain-containing protein n=1 Tax=Pararhizobium sp. BT-229 TaxID=2986923 RepID=UPI0021F7A71B|nr:DUF5680 domain-containing protein [Pararhizobium sp. BT-229]MCV9965605.1 DUF5680 domain-containing protein [Pararhizobium sp. BT-229]
MCDIDELTAFILEAKAKTYVGGGTALPSCRQASHDIGYARGGWSYLDSYFGGTDFSGQEVVWDAGTPVWAMTYFGRIILPDLIDGNRAGVVIKAALATMYAQHARFLGGMRYAHEHGLYIDESEGDTQRFRGREVIVVGGRESYELDYRGGLIRP